MLSKLTVHTTMISAPRQLGPEEFPPLLLEITDPPKELYVVGELPTTGTYLTVVGSRKYTPYGKEACEHLIAGLSGSDITIISGLALGMDSIAHQAALTAGLPTIAVPGSGLSEAVLYPRSNLQLAARIVKEGGALLSEFAPEVRATISSFPQRNRIMAGMAHATLIIEAANKSGTLITSRFATEYNRDVLAVPGSIFSTSSYGPHMLIRLGATPIRTSADIAEALGISLDPVRANTNTVSENEKLILEALSIPMSKDALIARVPLSPQDVNVILSTLELKGLLEERMGEIHLLQ